MAPTRAADSRYGPGRGLSSRLRNFPADAQGEEDGRPRRVRSPTETEDGQDGHSCSMSMDLADPVSSGKCSAAVVFTAPVAEPTVMSFTVPLNGYSIVATATVVTSSSSSASVLRECLRRDVVWWWIFHFWWCLQFGLGQCDAYDWNFLINFFQYQDIVGCVCMLNSWFSSNDEICADNYNYFPVQVEGQVSQ